MLSIKPIKMFGGWLGHDPAVTTCAYTLKTSWLGVQYFQQAYIVLMRLLSKSSALKRGRLIRKHAHAVIVHAHYSEAVAPLLKYLGNLDCIGFDLYVTATSAAVLNEFSAAYPSAHLCLVENRGRDILPFIEIYRAISGLGYQAICKIHTKRSLYRTDGDTIRDEQVHALLGSSSIAAENIKKLVDQPKVGLLVPQKYLIEHTDHNMTYDHAVVTEICTALGIEFKYSIFPAGSMFWFKPAALTHLLRVQKAQFPIESGLADGTPAHAVERVFALVAEENGFIAKGC